MADRLLSRIEPPPQPGNCPCCAKSGKIEGGHSGDGKAEVTCPKCGTTTCQYCHGQEGVCWVCIEFSDPGCP